MVILYFIITFLAALFPAFIWLWFFLKEDVRPEPKRLIIYTISLGALVSIPTLAAQILFRSFAGGSSNATILSIAGLALIEEIFKFLAVYTAVHKDPAFDEPVDAMVYSIAAAAGFATIENFFIIGNSLQTIPFLSFQGVVETIALRFIGATLLHILASAIVGYYWARGILAKQLKRWIWKGLLFATIVHGVFNFLIFQFQASNLIYPSLFLIAAAFFVMSDFEKLRIKKEPFSPAEL